MGSIMLIRIFIYALVTVLTSFYFFPFEFTFLPGLNTKMMMAVVGLAFLVYNGIKSYNNEIKRDFLGLTFIAIAIGLISFVSMVYNNTPDNSYLTYVFSVWVWSSASYAVLSIIHLVHGKITFRLISNYIIAVCVVQTTLAFSMQFVPALKSFVDSFLAGWGFMGKNIDRLYGVGAALDPSGLRFACILTLIMYILINGSDRNNGQTWLYLLAYGIILVFGNMMSRTTIVGVLMSMALLTFVMIRSLFKRREDSEILGAYGVLRKLSVIIVIVVPLLVLLYNTNDVVRTNLRFGFEGFFALVEDGYWHTSSSDNLENHWVFPNTLETWVIGDGYIASTDINPYYVGTRYAGFYKGTDIGYCRFLLYFGLIGTIVMVCFFLFLAKSCARNHPGHELLFLLFLLINLIGWFKVSSDVIMVFLPYLFIRSSGLDEDCWRTT